MLNPNVIIDTGNKNFDKLIPEKGYALWDETEEGNMNSITGEPYCYWLQIIIPKDASDSIIPHIKAKLIDESMEVF